MLIAVELECDGNDAGTSLGHGIDWDCRNIQIFFNVPPGRAENQTRNHRNLVAWALSEEETGKLMQGPFSPFSPDGRVTIFVLFFTL